MWEQGLSMVHTEAFLAEEGVFKCVNMRDVDLLSRFEFMKAMSGVQRGPQEAAKEIWVI